MTTSGIRKTDPKLYLYCETDIKPSSAFRSHAYAPTDSKPSWHSSPMLYNTRIRWQNIRFDRYQGRMTFCQVPFHTKTWHTFSHVERGSEELPARTLISTEKIYEGTMEVTPRCKFSTQAVLESKEHDDFGILDITKIWQRTMFPFCMSVNWSSTVILTNSSLRQNRPPSAYRKPSHAKASQTTSAAKSQLQPFRHSDHTAWASTRENCPSTDPPAPS
jgi:hypothetical protein